MKSAPHIVEETVAPSGLTSVPTGTSFGAWTGAMLIGGLVAEGVVRLRLEEGRVADKVTIGPNGDLRALTEHEDGEVLRLSPED